MFFRQQKRKDFLLDKTVYINCQQIESITINVHLLFWQVLVIRMTSGRTYRINPNSHAGWVLGSGNFTNSFQILDKEAEYEPMDYKIGGGFKSRE